MNSFYKAYEHHNNDTLYTCAGLIRAGFQGAVEVITFTAVVESRVSVDAEEISLTIFRLLVETVLLEAKAFDGGILRALES